MTQVANPTVGAIEDAVEKYGLDALVEVGLASLFQAAPWLGVWPLRQIVSGVTRLLADKLFAFIRLVIDLKVIAFVNAQNQKTFEREVVKLRALARGYGTDSEQFKKGRADAKAAFADFVRFNGA